MDSQSQSDSVAHLCPLMETEFLYENDQNQPPIIAAKEVLFTAPELAKLKKDFSHHPGELKHNLFGEFL